MYQPKEDMADGLGLTSSDDKPRDRERRLYSNLGVDPKFPMETAIHVTANTIKMRKGSRATMDTL
jgi:hypothetical protein